MAEYDFLTYEELDAGRVVRITLNRPRYRNAQSRSLLVELDAAFLRAEADDEVRVVILAGAGKSFSAGHDMGTPQRAVEREPGPDQHATFGINGATRSATEKRMIQEWHHYYQNSLRWRDLRKITIAQVHGDVLAAGLTLAWACDLIVGAQGTTFADPVGTRLGMCGVEYFAHPWEFGARRTKELMLTGGSVGVDEAHRLGMVSQVYQSDQLAQRTEEYAVEIAKRPTMTALLIKESVNQTQDVQGFRNALQAAFSIHQVNHAHWAELHGDDVAHALPDDGAVPWRRDASPHTGS
ncbi:putative enoyl-CoA hydratase EchA13 (plasmid) [Mycolicibacterium madagascariense]|uniref:Putative enoyl-CoA hydratase EchA13 n=1 Tax=Mycolicibacterium madagascariense TaxID=212765 RepID=A0A7I7XPQ7_9MYCO|nr:enoyl-CoA hydratase [Mycolicibacterium madagascariense]BBZ31228.1 putative enoyl-CoA hydratase EchA13 [Mycolicibacterium madagascariense]